MPHGQQGKGGNKIGVKFFQRRNLSAQILLQSPDNYFTRPGTERSTADVTQQIDEQAVASQVQIVQSRDLAREAIKRLDLVGNPEFDKSSDLLRRLLAFVGMGRGGAG